MKNLHKNLCWSALILYSSIIFAAKIPICPDYDEFQHKPNFNMPYETKFNHFLNRLLSRRESFHIVNDEVITAKDTLTLTGKFDYGALKHKDLEDEYIDVYISGSHINNWKYIGEYKTNYDGKVFIELRNLSVGQYVIRMVVKGDLTYADGYVTVIQENQQAVIFDIDGTLTRHDLAQLVDYPAISYAKPRDGAVELIHEYMKRNYQIIYLTARVYWYGKGTREWLDYMTLPQGILRMSKNITMSLFDTAEYKADYINQLKSKGVDIIRAYGNAKTDAEAYQLARIKDSYIIGKNAGYLDSHPIYEDGYYTHIQDKVLNLPYARCSPVRIMLM